MIWRVPTDDVLRTDWELVRTWDDPDHDKVHVHVAIRNDVVYRAQLGERDCTRHVVDAMRGAVSATTLTHRYDQRPRPKLGAGTVGYARRRRT